MALRIDAHGIRRFYETVDENGDGRLTTTEMHRYLGRLGIEISGEDLKYLAIPMSHSEDGCEDLNEAFKVYDMNNDGFISSTELQRVLCNLGFMEGEDIANCQKMIGTYDSDSNGLLDFFEFKTMMNSHSPANLADVHRSQSE